MDFLLSDFDKIGEVANSSFDEYLTESERKQVCNATGFHPDDSEFKRLNIGPGADLMVILAAVWSVVEVIGTFYTAIDLSVKFGKYIAKINEFVKSRKLVSMDEDAAKLLVMNYLVETFKTDTVQLINAHTVTPSCGGTYKEYPEHPIANAPHRYYIFEYRIDGGHTVVLGVKSTGEIEVIKAFEFDPYGLEELPMEARITKQEE